MAVETTQPEAPLSTRPLISQGGKEHPGRLGHSAVPDRADVNCIANAARTLRLARKFHKTADPVHVASRVRAYMKQRSLLFDRIVVLLFWGRERYTSLLKPYLMRELSAHGGVVDEIWLCLNTGKRPDAEFGRAWARDSPQVKTFEVFREKPDGISYCFNHVIQNNSRTLFLKVDDDIVRMEHHALTHLAAHKIFHPSAAFRQHGIASANVINHGHLPYLHEALGAWAPLARHRYDYHKYSAQPGDSLLANGIRQHMAYLSHVDAGTTDAYRFGTWDMNQCSCEEQLAPRAMNRCVGGVYYRWGINAIAFGGSLVDGQRLPDNNDEWWVTAGWPQWLDQHAEVAGDAIVVHYAYTRQRTASFKAIDNHPLFANYTALARAVTW